MEDLRHNGEILTTNLIFWNCTLIGSWDPINYVILPSFVGRRTTFIFTNFKKRLRCSEIDTSILTILLRVIVECVFNSRVLRIEGVEIGGATSRRNMWRTKL